MIHELVTLTRGPTKTGVALMLAVCASAACAEPDAAPELTREEPVLTAQELTLFPCDEPGTDPNFYTFDRPMASSPGGLIKCERLTPTPATPPPAGTVTGYRVMYRTTMRHRYAGGGSVLRAVPATGTIFVPEGETTTRPIVANTHGLSGVIAACAPSFTGAYDKGRIDSAFADQTVKPVVVAPDYVGLGVDHGVRVEEKDYEVWYPNGAMGRPFANVSHPMVSLDGEGRATIDLVLAARQIPGANVGEVPRWIAMGQSQGGHAALAAAEVAAGTYGSGKQVLKGVIAGAPATELDKNAWWHPDLKNSVFGMIAASLPLEWRALRATDYLSMNGELAIDSTTNQLCFEQDTLLQTLATYNVVDLFNNDPFSDPAALNALHTNSPGNNAIGDVPVFVGTVRGDPFIDHRRTGTFVDEAVYKANITFCEYYGGTVKNASEQYWYMMLHWAARALDHDAFKKMFGNQVHRIGCKAGLVPGSTPAEFVNAALAR